jgi:predicted RNA-binding Zn ribbon-like protein
VRIANLAEARKRGRGPAIKPDPFVGPATAAAALGVSNVEKTELGSLRVLHGVVVELVDGLITDEDVPRAVAAINRLAAGSQARARLDLDTERGLVPHLEWADDTVTAMLARRVVLELVAIDARRLRRCQREACNLIFYDTTRSNTQRWHAESPCGLRERQERHRAARAGRHESQPSRCS